MSSLTDILRNEIASQGVISFARFMQLALYCPEHGYYERPSKQIGCQGDFYTSVSVGSVFGELLAYQMAQWLDDLNSSSRTDSSTTTRQIVESGAHNGQLATDILNWFRQFRPDLEAKLEYWILEPSAQRRYQQEKLLERFAPVVRWSESWEALPCPVQGVIFANELLDAFPLRRVSWEASPKRWFEWGVGWESGRFVWQRMTQNPARAPDPPSHDEWPRVPEALRSVLPDGFTTELCSGAASWWKQAARALTRGKLVTLDYGLTADEFFLPERARGTLRAYRNHHPALDVLANPGKQDLTAQVNFTALIDTGESEGLTTEEFTTQARYLTRIFERTAIRASGFAAWKSDRLRQCKTLIHPEHLGRPFKVLVQSR